MASTNSQTPSSSLTSISTTPTKWDVFLSFRDIDTLNNFTAHLYDALGRHSIRTFVDDPDLRSGEVISDALPIQASKTYIVVLSENYASWSWCLDQLVEILSCSNTMQRLVIPVFYNIDPSVVRYQTGSFEEDFRRHEVRFASERVNNWRHTLKEVANKSGIHVDGKRSVADIINEIVYEILLQIKPTVLHVAEYPVGLNSRVDDITALLSGSTKGVIKIGIYGMGGVGKTTLAKALFNHLLPGSFKGSCFLENVRETSGILKGLEFLQQQLINDVLKSKKDEVRTVDEGTKLIESRICSTKILVVIDDLDDHKIFKSLVGPFASGSVVIITTRDEGTLDRIEVKTKYRYRVNELGDAESETLFFRHAFGDTTPDNTRMILSKDILRLAGGLPLALKVFGSYLYKESVVGWKSYIEMLQRNPNSTIQQRLMISLNALEADDPFLKKMFLDIACFFIGREKEHVVEILDTYYSYAEVQIDILMKKCLLTIDDHNEFRMHGLLQDVGKEIARNNSPDEPGKHSRLWKPKDIYHVLEEQKGTEAIEGIMLHRFKLKDPFKEVSFGMETFRRMSKLRFLSFDDINLTGKFERTLEDLRWFCWSGCPLKCLPFDFRPQQIVILELPHSKMITMWEVNKVPNVFEKLKTLNMSFSRDLTTTPDFIRLPCLRKLNFDGCTSLKEVHNSIGSLVSLVSLNLNFCKNLRSLPDTICNLRALEVICIEGCTMLEALPIQLGNIKSLKELNAACLAVLKLPDSIGNLSKLVKLEIGHNKELECLPDTICNLRALEVLNISHCTKVKELPEELGKIESLKELNAAWLAVSKLPDSICNMRSLEILDISYCDKLERLPDQLWKLTRLKARRKDSESPEKLANYSEELSTVPPGQKDSEADEWEWGLKLNTRLLKERGQKDSISTKKSGEASVSMNALSTGSQADELDPELISGIVKKVKLEISPADEWEWGLKLNTRLLKERGQKDSISTKKSGEASVSMNALSTGSQADELDPELISGIVKKVKLEISPADEMEVQLDFQESYYNLFDIEELLGLLKKDLEYNVLESKHVLVRNLKVMDIWVPKLSEIPNNLSFPDLEKLFLYTNSDSKNIPDSFFKGRPVVHYSNLDLSSIPPSFFERMSSLKELNLTDSRMKTLPPSVLKLINLEKLILKGCAQLIEIPHNISALENLTALDLSGCTNLVELPESFKQLKNLCSLDLTNCKSLTGLPSSFSGARSLLSLSLSGCQTFAEIPESFEFPQNLNSLNLTDCKRLTKVPESVCRLQFLNYLSLSGCENLATFPESFGKLQKLCTLELRDCKRLTRLPESLGMLTGLQILDLHGCTNLAEIPEAIESLKRLTSLDLSDCESLTKLPESISEIPFLRNIKLSGCSSLFEFHGPQVSVKCLSWNIGEPNRKQVELDFHETPGTPSDITEILGLMEKVLQHQLLKSEELEVAVIKLKVIHASKSKVPEILKKLSFPDLEKLVLQPDIDLISSITSSFFEQLPTFKVLDMSHSDIKTLPSCVYELTDLKGLILQHCELLIELPDGIGALENLELLDLEGTDLVCLPNELGKLINLKCLKVSLYDDESYRKSKKIIDIIPTAVLSKLTELEELSINFDPQDVWCSALVKAIIVDLLSLRKLKTLKLYLPTTELLQNLMELKSNEDDLSIHKNLSNFTVIIGPHGQRFISRLPCDLEEEYLKLKKCLKYIGGKNTSEFADALKQANALYLDRHWYIQKLSVFKADELNKLKFCMLVDCNEMQTVFDASDFSLEDNIFSLQYLAIHYLKNLEEIGKGPSVGCCLQALKVLVLHMCPNLTTIFTQVLLGDLVNLEELIVEDCAKITSLIAKDSTQLNGTEYLPRLKKMTLLYLPKLESISSGISIGPELENVIIYNCPKLKTLPSLGVRNEEVIKIKGKGEWWNALEWIGGRPQYLHNAFSQLDMEGDFLDELETQYVNSLRLFVECNAD